MGYYRLDPQDLLSEIWIAIWNFSFKCPLQHIGHFVQIFMYYTSDMQEISVPLWCRAESWNLKVTHEIEDEYYAIWTEYDIIRFGFMD